MKVSVVIPFYNTQRYIRRCAESLCAQTYDDLELIFVDDGSTDDSRKILLEQLGVSPSEGAAEEQLLTPNSSLLTIKLLAHEQNRGSAMARKTGMQAATGEYIIHVDSDDFVEPDFISSLAQAVTREDADVAICDFYEHHQHDTVVRQMPQYRTTDECFAALITGAQHNGLWNKLIRRSIFVDNDIFPVEGINMYDDKTILLRAFYFVRHITYVSQPLYHYNRANINSISAQNKQKEVEPAMRCLWLNRQFFDEHDHTQTVEAALQNYYQSIRAIVLLYGTRAQRNQFKKLGVRSEELGVEPNSQNSTLNSQLSTLMKKLPLHYHLALWFDNNHLGAGNTLLRLALHTAAKLKKIRAKNNS